MRLYSGRDFVEENGVRENMRNEDMFSLLHVVSAWSFTGRSEQESANNIAIFLHCFSSKYEFIWLSTFCRRSREPAGMVSLQMFTTRKLKEGEKLS